MNPTNLTPDNLHAPFVSVFERTFDSIVIGAGLIGYAAAKALAAQGRKTLLVEPSGDLLWECTRALENRTTGTEQSPDWDQWIATSRERSGANDRFFEPALAEILTAAELSSAGAPFAALLYASPVAAELADRRIASVTVATKAGPRHLRAHHWIDTTERGQLTRLVQPAVAARAPAQIYRSLVLHSQDLDALDAALPLLAKNHPGLEWFSSVRSSERRLRWPVVGKEDAWHRKVPALVADLRALLVIEGEPTRHFVATHCAMADFPIYEATSLNPSHSLPANLHVASPTLRHEPLATPADRFSLGSQIAGLLSHVIENNRGAIPAAAAVTLPSATEVEAYDVVVAGAGTGGALAAIAAARTGVRTLVFDFTPYPGGIGTGAGICGYFHGAKGGLQDEIDLRVQAMTALLTGAPAGLNGWHHEAKKIALLSLFDEAGATFLGDVLLTGIERTDSGRVLAALAVVDGRLARIPAAAFIDGTGDGDLAALAGAQFKTGRPGDGRTLSYSQSIFSLSDKEARLNVRSCNFDAGWVDPCDVEDLSRARLIGIAQHLQPEWTQPDRAIAVAPLLGLRQSRQIETDRSVSMVDLVGHARFDDSIGEVETVADTHSVDYEFETDELAFYYWSCRGFRHPLRSELPYRMLLPRNLTNVWVACRAAGIDVDAAYGLRMQREIQRFGEAAGIAASLSVQSSRDSRALDFALVGQALDRSGCRRADRPLDPTPDTPALVASLEKGLPGIHLWHLYRDQARHHETLLEQLASSEPRVSFYAAVVLAMWKDAAAEPRLIEALENKEEGPSPEEKPVPGAFAQCIDLPFWLQSVVLLRRVGSERCLPALRALAGTVALPLNVRTTLALTLERLATRVGLREDIRDALGALLTDAIPDPLLPPSRSLWRTLHSEPQKRLGNDRGANTREDHTWQLHLIIARIRKQGGLAPSPESTRFAQDSRAFVRDAFAQVAADGPAA